jgi:excinuclease ABC subunit A
MNDVIRIRGAREHNLKNIDVELPRNQLIVMTGLSGSGKSSLAFDTIYAEGQRRYVESLSAYARQFLGMMEKPDVDQIEGLSPAISIDQKSTSHNPRSTVATVTEIYDYLRLLFARVGTPHCPICGQQVTHQSQTQIVDSILQFPDKTRLLLLAPVVVDRKGEFRHVPEELQKSGFARVRVDGVTYDVEEFPSLDKNYTHTIEVVVDRIATSEDVRSRLAESVEQGIDLADGTINVYDVDQEKEHIYSDRFACVDHPEAPIPEMAPRSFSFNSPHGACPTCTGLGVRLEVDPDLAVPNPRLTIAEGAIRPWSWGRQEGWYQRHLSAVAEKYGFTLHAPWRNLAKEHKNLVLYGEAEEEKTRVALGRSGRTYTTTFEGVIPNLQRRYYETDSDFLQKEIEKYMRERTCQTCQGARLKPEVLAVTVGDKSIVDVTQVAISQAREWFGNLTLSERQQHIGQQILKEINERLRFLSDVGLDYLTLDRSATTLSGGEAQRIRLATQIGSRLTGVLYVLDEPSIGLHQRDNRRLLDTLKRLRDLGNTVIVVEHDEETIRAADTVLDIGPAAGENGGQVVALGDPDAIAANTDSLTGDYLAGRETIRMPSRRRPGTGNSLRVIGAQEHNLQNIDVDIPLGKFLAVAGVSGSGKSSLVNDIIAKHLATGLHQASQIPGDHEDIEGTQHLDKAITITQSPIGRTPRSNPATYTNVFTDIRALFAQTPEARIRGYKQGRFSFNVAGGRCEVCRGDGMLRIEMHFLPDVYVTCEECKGKRYNREVLEIHYKNKTIADVLDMTVEESLEFFANQPRIKRRLETLHKVGLGYIKLGQPATTLSGGEAQRIKLATELSRRSTGKTLYILDEPTTGLHFLDVQRLLDVLHELVDGGNTVAIIEHHLDVIKNADWVIDLGPEGGSGGGKIVAEGTPEDVAKNPDSYTGQYLKEMV